MRTLCLLRHAKSSWDDPSLHDHDRPLAERGRGAAPQIAAWIKMQGLKPELVLCSSAARARETWALVEASLGWSAPLRELRDLYLAAPRQLLRIVRGAPQEISTLVVVGHNPGLQSFAGQLVVDGPAKLRRRMRRKFPTAALALITFEVEGWPQVEPGTGTLSAFIRPKDLS